MTLNMVPIGQAEVFDTVANLAYLVRHRIDLLCLDQETAEALADAEDLIRQVILKHQRREGVIA